jgi:hypothetical protein
MNIGRLFDIARTPSGLVQFALCREPILHIAAIGVSPRFELSVCTSSDLIRIPASTTARYCAV